MFSGFFSHRIRIQQKRLSRECARSPTRHCGAGAADLRAHLLAARPQMQGEGEFHRHSAHLVVIIALVQAWVLRRLGVRRSPARPANP